MRNTILLKLLDTNKDSYNEVRQIGVKARSPRRPRFPGSAPEQPFQQFIAGQALSRGNVAQNGRQGSDAQRVVRGDGDVVLRGPLAGQPDVAARLPRLVVAQ